VTSVVNLCMVYHTFPCVVPRCALISSQAGSAAFLTMCGIVYLRERVHNIWEALNAFIAGMVSEVVLVLI
jgi:hypothetical protein